MNRLQDCRYYCSICGHTLIFANNQNKKLCNWCGLYVERPRLSVEMVTLMKRLERRHKIFLEKKEEPTEMTIEEIEEKLGMTKGSLRVKGVNE